MEDEMNKFLITAAATVSAALLSTTASAQSDSPAPSARISYSDLDLRTDAGRQALEARLASAVGRLCWRGIQSGAEAEFERRRCMRTAHVSAQSGARIAIARAYRGENRDVVLAAR
jgi:UrcA family protein